MAVRGALLPVELFDFATSDPEAARVKLDELYPGQRTWHPGPDGLWVRVSHYAVGELWIDHLRVGGAMSPRVGSILQPLFGFLHGGRWSGITGAMWSGYVRCRMDDALATCGGSR
ncbi:hypothetical protein ACIBL8_46600 [Streptomyces sp. NPDC050523]|uniref:hypothetical protein n=1 Tax=Streptomyces sp. NPDC050523 TaxID=3365622 RepID=UPI0037910ECD